MTSYFIDGVGDEVTIVVGIFFGLVIIVIAWLSTRVNDTRILEANDNTNAIATELNNRNLVLNQPNGNSSPQTNLNQENSANSSDASARVLDTSPSSSQENDISERQSESPSTSADNPESSSSAVYSSDSVLRQRRTDNSSGVNINPTVDSGPECTPSPATGNTVSIRLKFMNETVRTVQVNPDITLDQFRRSNFPVETASRYRLIFRGQVLRDGSQTLKQLHVVDETDANSTSTPVIHCFLSNNAATDAGGHLASSASRQLELAAEELHIGSLLLPLLGLVLTFLWYLCIFHTSLFSIQSVVSIIGFTFFYIVLLITSMKLIHRNINKDSSGQVTLIAEDGEDMWHAYNIIQAGDSLRSSTVRKVQVESNTGSVGSSRVRTTLTISVEALDFDSVACVLRVKGRNIVENQFVKMGAYHTLDLEQNRKFTLAKNCWDSVVLDRIDAACDPTQNADVAAIVMQEGIAHVCLVLSSMTLVRAKIEMHIPRKKRGSSQQHDKVRTLKLGMASKLILVNGITSQTVGVNSLVKSDVFQGVEKFFESLLQAILRHVNFEVVKCVLLASPGFVKDQFYEYMFSYAVKTDSRVLIENKSKFVLVHSSSGFKHSLKEVLSNPAVLTRLADTKAAGEIRALEAFYKMLQVEPNRAYYGEKEIEKASEAQAIDTLLICDSLLRTHDVAKRKRLVRIVDSVRDNGGTVRMFSAMHITGEQLAQLTGIAALLRFPVADLTDDETSEDDDA